MTIKTTLPPQKAILYLRKSQDKKEKGQIYSIEAQRTECLRFAEANNIGIVREFVEVGSGADEERPELQKAVALAELSGYPIIVLRVDRISRKNSHLASLVEKPKLTFLIAELGISATSFQILLFGLLATEERALLSRRTKEGLARAKARGVKLGTSGKENIKQAHKARRSQGQATALRFGPMIEQMKEGRSWQAVADELNRLGIPTPARKKSAWKKMSCYAILKRYKELSDVST